MCPGRCGVATWQSCEGTGFRDQGPESAGWRFMSTSTLGILGFGSKRFGLEVHGYFDRNTVVNLLTSSKRTTDEPSGRVLVYGNGFGLSDVMLAMVIVITARWTS